MAAIDNFMTGHLCRVGMLCDSVFWSLPSLFNPFIQHQKHHPAWDKSHPSNLHLFPLRPICDQTRVTFPKLASVSWLVLLCFKIVMCFSIFVSFLCILLFSQVIEYIIFMYSMTVYKCWSQSIFNTVITSGSNTRIQYGTIFTFSLLKLIYLFLRCHFFIHLCVNAIAAGGAWTHSRPERCIDRACKLATYQSYTVRFQSSNFRLRKYASFAMPHWFELW